MGADVEEGHVQVAEPGIYRGMQELLFMVAGNCKGGTIEECIGVFWSFLKRTKICKKILIFVVKDFIVRN